MIKAREKLFEEWAALEPARCSCDRQGGFLVGSTYFRAFEGIASDAMLRREVQRALHERGWQWQIDLGDPVLATVQPVETIAPFRGAAPEYPGEALLTAYLGALKRN
ncbi:MAG TPA: hypothetical protein VF168_13420 [Trueperaceae bacterium]